MSNKFISTTSAFLLSTSILVADIPKVTVDIAPVHSLVSKVMNGGFIQYMKSVGKLGGQNKVPRLANNRDIADKLIKFLYEK